MHCYFNAAGPQQAIAMQHDEADGHATAAKQPARESSLLADCAIALDQHRARMCL